MKKFAFIAIPVLMVLLIVFIVMRTNDTTQEVVAEKVELVFWHGIESPENNEVLKKLVTKFNDDHPQIEVKLQHFGAADQVQGKVMTAVQGGNQPELMWWAPAFTGMLAEADVLAAADDLMADDDKFDKNDIYPGLWEVSKYKGKIYTVPFEANNLAIYYNKKHFAEAGIEKIPETWDEFYKVAKKLTTKKRYGFLVPVGTNEWTVWTWQTLLWQAGGDFLNKNNDGPAFNSEAGETALKFWKKMIDTKVAAFSETDTGYKPDYFVSGKFSMMINGPWNLVSMKDNKELGIFFLPKKVRYATNIGGENLFIFKSTPEKEAASWEFAKFIMSAQFQVEWAMKTGYLPVSLSAAKSPKYLEFLKENPNVKVYVDQMKHGLARPSIPEYNEISAALGKQLEQALFGEKTPSKALADAAKAAKKVFDK